MNATHFLTRLSVLAAISSACTVVAAQDLSSSTEVIRAVVAGHAYQNGGIAQDEVADMRQHLKPYDLHLTFSEGRHNDYAADIALVITDFRGRQVFDLSHAGPLTDVDLPAGTYHVVADFGGVVRSGNVDVKPGAPASLNLHWPKDET